jgi:N-acetylglucosaminyldiphosphoundecaprenol N-acetyl-beta-D-mannosaminyltransferase
VVQDGLNAIYFELKHEMPKNNSRLNILGVLVSAINMSIALDTMRDWIICNKKNYICVTPAHSIMDAYYDPHFRDILNRSGLTTPDGMAIVWLLKLAGYKDVSRVYGPDLMLAVAEESLHHGWTHFLYGGAPGVADKLSEVLINRFPGLKVCGTYCPPFRPLTPAEDQEVVETINSAQPDIVWVGISSPKQELWMAEHIHKLGSPVLVGVGAAFDFLSGAKQQAPRWIQRSGLEWLFRLASEPRRLWRRYIEYPYFALLVFAQWTGLRKYPS